MDKKELCDYAKTLYENNLSCKEIKDALLRQGIDEALASEIIDEIDTSIRKENNRNGKKALIVGIAVFFLSIALSIASYVQADPGEVYRVYWKGIGGGGFCILYGLADWIKSIGRRE